MKKGCCYDNKKQRKAEGGGKVKTRFFKKRTEKIKYKQAITLLPLTFPPYY